jgi:hypothetical protein
MFEKGSTMLRATVWVLILAMLPLGMMFITARPVLAVSCPQCFGFTRIADGVYAESSMPAADRDHALQVLAESERRVTAFYGSLQHRPRLLVCGADACYDRIGGMQGTGTGSVGYFAIVVASQALDPVLIATTLAHAELMGRVGMWRMKSGAVPAWFDAGAAVLASDDPAYLAPASRKRKDRCLTGPGGELPEEADLWQERVQQFDYLNAAAACRVDLWMIAHGGSQAVTALLGKLADGQSFDTLYR